MPNQSPENTVTISRTTISNTLDYAKKNQQSLPVVCEKHGREQTHEGEGKFLHVRVTSVQNNFLYSQASLCEFSDVTSLSQDLKTILFP